MNYDLDNAQKLLKRSYSFTGKVIRGKGLGRNIGCPTANIEIDGRKFLPGEGVYAAWTSCDKLKFKVASVMNLGPQPTIDPLAPSAVEVHLIDQNIDLYDSKLKVIPVRKIRSQKRFLNIEELSKQISLDIKMAKDILKEEYKNE